MFEHISSNVREMKQEKALIASGNRELAQLTQAIRDKLGEAGGVGLAQNLKQHVGIFLA